MKIKIFSQFFLFYKYQILPNLWHVGISELMRSSQTCDGDGSVVSIYTHLYKFDRTFHPHLRVSLYSTCGKTGQMFEVLLALSP